ncbi:MAG TPA: hypoxanthine phosphoribosyltransferase [Bryobacteraceae bacterium]|jgi:hypoxanthine phosphoribosyltransferase|nr:hypoxanthine phosphoribosyltransferase [Bryobacteraceae bacterium]
MALVPRVFLTAEQIQKRVQEMGDQISANYPDGPIYLIAILKGAFIFLADLSRAIRTPSRIEFMGISSYGRGKTSSGQVRVTKDLDVSIEGHHVLIVEDIVDSGVTLTYLLNVLEQRRPKSLAIATLLDKPERRLRPVQASYVGFKIPDEFVVGYGLDFAEDYRNLKDICILGEE